MKKSRIQKIGRIGVLVCLAIVIFMNGGCKWSTTPEEEERSIFTLRIFPSENDIDDVGDIATVDVMVDQASALIAARFTLSYDPSIVQVTRILTTGDGLLLTEAGVDVTEIESTIDNENGKVVVGLGALQKGFTGARGSGSLAIVTFEGKNYGESDIRFVNNEPDDIVTSIYSSRSSKGWIDLSPVIVHGTILVKQPAEEPEE